MRLYGRDAELAALSDLLDQARNGTSGALVLRGDPGIGKTALVTHVIEVADGFRVIRGAGIEEESELPYAGLHLLLRQALDRIAALPDVQAEALRGALGLARTGTQDRFLVGLAVLSLLAELAAEQPLLCVVDDAQWLDRASADALLFAARRLDSESVALLLCARTGALPAAGLPELTVPGLSAQAATELLPADLPASRRYRVLAEAAGNPLALLELPGVLPGAQPEAPLPLTDRLLAAFESQLAGLPAATRTVLLVAAAEGAGDLGPILRAAGTLGASLADLEPARAAGLVEVSGGALTFRHPLIRAAVHHAAPLALRHSVHQALAAALDSPGQADRRAWQLAAAAGGPDEEIAAALERAAGRVRDRGGDSGAMAWYQRAAELSADPVGRARRLTLAAEAAAASGDLDQAAALAAEGLGLAGLAPEQAQTAARALQAQATVAFLRGDPAAAHRRLLEASELIAPVDKEQANALLIEAVHSGWYVGQGELAEGVTRLEGLRLRPTALDRLLLRAVAPILGRPADDTDPDRALAEARSAAAGHAPGLVLVSGLALLLGQDRAAQQIGDELSRELRTAGQIGWLPTALFYAGSAQAYGGRHEEALRTVAEGLRLARDTGQQRWVDALAEPLALLAAARGDERLCRQITDEALGRTSRPAWSVPWTASTLGLLDLGLGRAESALARLETLAAGRRFFHIPATRSTPDLVEAAVRVGRPEAAAEPLALFETWSANTGQSWTTALVRRCRALLDGDEELFVAALALHEGDSRPFDEARTRLLYGEWLRREKRKADARSQLRVALETLERIGAAPWAERARTELTATGITGRPGDHGRFGSLTPQELQIVRLAGQGLSNKDIAAQLFLSARTVGHHLYKAYPKLGVASRGELAGLDLG
ncbi:MAG TPA: AAA family ATPase [Trebonia sp.]|jgi:DNA-binding CsgD family transcriptional regulator|nr:AAA family ATPase [Trebonia sp.]